MTEVQPHAVLLSIARDAIRASLQKLPFVVPTLEAPFAVSRGVFVTLRSPQGDLRGCIGHLEPQHSTLAAEIADCAVSSATRDPRMTPVSAQEIDKLVIEISLLTPSEPTSVNQLDPEQYGVIVSKGMRRGVLLPGIEGVHSVEQQLHIAKRKAGIADHETVSIERFKVEKVSAPHIT